MELDIEFFSKAGAEDFDFFTDRVGIKPEKRCNGPFPSLLQLANADGYGLVFDMRKCSITNQHGQLDMPFALQHLLKFQDFRFLMWDCTQDLAVLTNMYGHSQWLVDTNHFLDVQTFAAILGQPHKFEEFVDSMFN